MFTICFLFSSLISLQGFSQTTGQANADMPGPRFSLRGGYDFWQQYKNNTPYIDYKGGPAFGASANYYWNWIGVGVDFDYIMNKPKSIYPADSLYDATASRITNLTLKEDKITRMFYGIGPSFKWQKNNRFYAEMFLRGGLANIKGGETSLTGDIGRVPVLLNFHGGYNAKNVPTGKAQLQATYNITPNIGLHAGAYYMHHFNVPELAFPGSKMSTGFVLFGPGYNLGAEPSIDSDKDFAYKSTEPAKHDIRSLGAFAGISFALGGKKEPRAKPFDPDRKFALAVIAKDKFTGEVLPNTDVIVKSIGGNVVRTGSTNSYGVVIFDQINPDDYTIEGKLHNVSLENGTTLRQEFRPGITLQKQIFYADEQFILRGQVVMCNTSTALQNVSVVLNNISVAQQKISNTDGEGRFVFHALQNASYSIYGKLNNFFSQTETVSTKNFDRNRTLFIKLEICMEKADCGTAITLKNIHYDLDKYFIREDAKPELNRLVQFLKDNPTVKVELSSHTDSRASDTYNLRLSQNRANAAVDYIASRGIARNRVVGVGYGESRLLNRCKDGVDCSEAEHQLNRRTEFKVICPDN